MTITSKNHNPQSTPRVATGSFKDTQTTPLKAIINLGWKPRYFKLWDVSATEVVFEVTDGMAAATAFKTIENGTLELIVGAMPQFIENYATAAADLWAVYETAVFGTGAAAKTDNSRLNLAAEQFTGVSIPAALVAQNIQLHWLAIG